MPYLTKVAIDFGSTNTVMAWKVYLIDNDGNLSISDQYNTIKNILRIPSMMILQADNSNNPAINRDIYGKEAEEFSRNSNDSLIVCDNFKQKLYTESVSTAEYQRGILFTEKFFVHLREVYRNEIFNRFPNNIKSDMTITLYLSTPVRANPTHQTIMKDIAVKAGFVKENGIDEIRTEYDEAICVVKHTVDSKRDDMSDIMNKAATPQGSTILFVDIGGSTADMILEKMFIKNGQLTLDSISLWPNADVKYPLGGCFVDEAIFNYMIKNGFTNREYAINKWKHGDGKILIRLFKEQNNEKLLNGDTIEKLGRVSGAMYDKDDDIFPDKSYNKAPQKIDNTIFEKEICFEYIEKMEEAFQELFKNQRPIEGQERIKPEDVDAIVLSGAGSKLYFIKDLFLKEKNRFKKIIENPKYLFADWEDPSLCCALGAMIELNDTNMPRYSRDKYCVKVRIYTMDNNSNMVNYAYKYPTEICPDIETYYDKYWSNASDDGYIGKIYCIFNEEELLTDKYMKLPTKISVEEKINYIEKYTYNIALQIILIRVDDEGRRCRLGTMMKIQSFDTTKALSVAVKGLASIPVFIAAVAGDVALGVLSEDWKNRNDEDKLSGKVESALDKFCGIGEKKELSMKMDMQLSEANKFTVDVELNGEQIEMKNQKLQIDF